DVLGMGHDDVAGLVDDDVIAGAGGGAGAPVAAHAPVTAAGAHPGDGGQQGAVLQRLDGKLLGPALRAILATAGALAPWEQPLPHLFQPAAKHGFISYSIPARDALMFDMAPAEPRRWATAARGASRRRRSPTFLG